MKRINWNPWIAPAILLVTLGSIVASALAPVAGFVLALFTQPVSYRIAINPQAYPTLEQFAGAVAMVIGKIEIIEQELYDRIVYPTAGIAQMIFFSTPQGAGFSSESGLAAAGNKTEADTNMTQNGQLPSPQAFWIDNIQADFDAGSVSTANLFTLLNPSVAVAADAASLAGIQDKNLVLGTGWLQLKIGEKEYYKNGPLTYFPPRAQKRVDVSRASADTTTHNATQTALMWIYGDLRTLDPGLGIATGVNFKVAINWPVVTATAASNGRIKVQLGGWLFRAAQ